MNRREINLVYAYIMNSRSELYDEYMFWYERVKRRSHDMLDLLELFIAKTRYDSFMEFSKHVLELLKL